MYTYYEATSDKVLTNYLHDKIEFFFLMSIIVSGHLLYEKKILIYTIKWINFFFFLLALIVKVYNTLEFHYFKVWSSIAKILSDIVRETL